MTIREYVLRMKAHYLKALDRRYEALIQAFDARSVRATTGKGKKLKYLHDHPDSILPISILSDKIQGKKSNDKFGRLKIIADRMKKYRGGGEDFEL